MKKLALPSRSSGLDINNKQNTERTPVVHNNTLGTDFIGLNSNFSDIYNCGLNYHLFPAENE